MKIGFQNNTIHYLIKQADTELACGGISCCYFCFNAYSVCFCFDCADKTHFFGKESQLKNKKTKKKKKKK